ncbi:DUF6415 family natural product biosynthesis protein [Streptomyces olindensis]|uniref:DUF6415 family natural product biosynthesis protein n=1 Tax=Streptomyces olindensis TaxID=358823 RepID=UPI0036600DF0
MIGTRSETDVPVPGVTAMRAQASWFLDQRTLPRHQATQLMARDLREFLEHLVPRIERLAAERSRDDAPVPAANVALAAVAEARRRMDEPEAAGLCGEVERVKSLARSVVSLCDHHDTLTGTPSACSATTSSATKRGSRSSGRAPRERVSRRGASISAVRPQGGAPAADRPPALASPNPWGPRWCRVALGETVGQWVG